MEWKLGHQLSQFEHCKSASWKPLSPGKRVVGHPS